VNLENTYAIPSLISAICFIVLTIYVLKNNPKRSANRVTALLFTGLIIWSLAEFLERLAGPAPDVLLQTWNELGQPYPPTMLEDYDFALFVSKLIGVGVLLIGPASVHFSLVVPRKRKVPLAALLLLYGIYIVLLILLFATDNLVAPPYPYYAGWGTQYGDWMSIYMAFPLVCVLFTVSMLSYSFIKAESVIERNQTKFVLLGIIINILLIVPTSVIPSYLGWNMYPLTTVSLIILAGFMTYSIVKYKLFVIEAVTEEAVAEAETIQRLEPGFSYLMLEKGTHYSYEIFRGMVSSTPGLCITAFYPRKFRREYRLEKTPIIWLTEATSTERALSPSRLEFEIVYNITTFMKENDRTVVMIDDLKYLALANGFEKVLGFMKGLVDAASVSDSTLIVPVSEELFEEDEFNKLQGIFDETMTLSSVPSAHKGDRLEPGYSYLIKEVKPRTAYSMISQAPTPGDFLCLTGTYPDKVRKTHSLEGGTYYWLTSSSSEEKTLDPGRLQFEVEQTVMEYIVAHPGGLVIIDGIDQLAQSASFPLVTDFLKIVVDVASVHDVTVLVPASPRIFKPIEISILEKRFDVIVDKFVDEDQD